MQNVLRAAASSRIGLVGLPGRAEGLAKGDQGQLAAGTDGQGGRVEANGLLGPARAHQ